MKMARTILKQEVKINRAIQYLNHKECQKNELLKKHVMQKSSHHREKVWCGSALFPSARDR